MVISPFMVYVEMMVRPYRALTQILLRLHHRRPRRSVEMMVRPYRALTHVVVVLDHGAADQSRNDGSPV